MRRRKRRRRLAGERAGRHKHRSAESDSSPPPVLGRPTQPDLLPDPKRGPDVLENQEQWESHLFLDSRFRCIWLKALGHPAKVRW